MSTTPTRSETDVLATARAAADNAFASHTPPGRGAVWWAVVVTLIAIATTASAFVYSYFYLRLGAESWPLPGTELRARALPLGALGAAVVAWAVAPTASRGRTLLALAAIAGLAAVGAQLWSLAESGYRPDANAYEALVITIEVLAALVVLAALIVRTATVAFYRTSPHGLLDADAALWTGALGLWGALWLVVHAAPGLI